MIPAFRVAIAPGDGIGKKVMPESLRVTQAAAEHFGSQLECRTIDWTSCDYYQQHGQMTPNDWKAQLKGTDAIFFDAVSWPATVPDHVSLWDSLLKFRHGLDQYISPCPVYPFEGMPCPLASHELGDTDHYVVRENAEGEYTSFGSIMYRDTDREIVIQESVYSRKGVERLLKFAFDLTQSRQCKHATLVTRSNGITINMP